MTRIKEILKEKGLTVNQLADMLEISRQALSKQIQGKMLVETAQRIAEALDVPMWQLFASPEEVKGEEDKNTLTCPKCGTKFKMEE
jgi:transcriptional regulator with XRE-family HTH domain